MSTQAQGDAVPEWTVGDRLRKAREVLGLEQGPFAERIGVSRGTVSNYERGTTSAYKPIVMRAWAMAAGVSLQWLETGVGMSSTPPPVPGKPSGDLAKLTESKLRRARGATTRQYLVPACEAA